MSDRTDARRDSLSSGRLPALPVRHLLWNIPKSFGGLTNTVLRRVSMLSEWDNREMEILLLSRSATPRETTDRLRAAGLISDGVRIRGMWEELRGLDDSDLSKLTGALVISSNKRRPTTVTSSDKTEFRDFLRSDGSLFAREHVSQETSTAPPTIALHDRAGVEVAQWKDSSQLCLSWLDFILGDEPSILVSDSPVTGGTVHNYRRSHITVLHALHSTHVNKADPTKLTPAGGKFFELLTHTDNFDRFVTLTTAQRLDMESSLIGSDNLTTVPNTYTGEPITELTPRIRTKGVVAARLEPIKRLDHIIQAVAAADGEFGPTLDVYGEGTEEGNLRTLIDQLELNETVTLHGFDPHARAAYEFSSFTFLTSKSEGQPLVLLEAMAAGCIPIAYDIDYGPADIITDGVDGFLVPKGDSIALTDALKRFLSMDEDDVNEMRLAAVHRAKDFHWEQVCEKWAKTYREATQAKTPVHRVQASPTLRALDMTPSGIYLGVDLTGKDSDSLEWALLTWVGRKANTYGRVPAQIERRSDRTTISGFLPFDRITWKSPAVLDIYVDVRAEGTAVRRRIKVPDSRLPPHVQGLEAYRTVNGNLSVKVAAQS